MYLIGIEKIKTGNLDSGEYEEININIARQEINCMQIEMQGHRKLFQ